MDANIVILTGNHLCNNPRVIKEATTLANAGYSVTVHGGWFDEGLKARDIELLRSLPFDFRPVIDGTQNRFRRFRLRASMKVGTVAHRLARLESRSQLGYTYTGLSAASRGAADLYIAHSEAAMAVAEDRLNDGSLVGIDLEDWFSEDLPRDARKNRPVRLLRELERKLLTSGGHSACPSLAMSEALASEFGCRQPTVIYNAFPWSDRKYMDGLVKDRRNLRLPSIHWFSQTLGRDRGLEDLVAALPLLKHEAEVHLRGKPVSGFDNWLASRMPEAWRGRIVVHQPVSNTELLSRIAEHDIGFAGETPSIRSRDLTVTNKILYYLLAGLSVVASDTAGQREVAEQATGGVFLYPSGDASALASLLDEVLGSANVLRLAKNAALASAERTFCWECQAGKLLESIQRALGSFHL